MMGAKVTRTSACATRVWVRTQLGWNIPMGRATPLRSRGPEEDLVSLLVSLRFADLGISVRAAAQRSSPQPDETHRFMRDYARTCGLVQSCIFTIMSPLL